MLICQKPCKYRTQWSSFLCLLENGTRNAQKRKSQTKNASSQIVVQPFKYWTLKSLDLGLMQNLGVRYLAGDYTSQELLCNIIKFSCSGWIIKIYWTFINIYMYSPNPHFQYLCHRPVICKPKRLILDPILQIYYFSIKIGPEFADYLPIRPFSGCLPIVIVKC